MFFQDFLRLTAGVIGKEDSRACGGYEGTGNGMAEAYEQRHSVQER